MRLGQPTDDTCSRERIGSKERTHASKQERHDSGGCEARCKPSEPLAAKKAISRGTHEMKTIGLRAVSRRTGQIGDKGERVAPAGQVIV